MDHIRNFSIIAHIDHGKSTLADRLIHRCGGLADREMSTQVLDSMDIERERGITIKAQTASLSYTARNGEIYAFNLIDTPGHVDFSYEVSRSLSACEGALLIVDATQGVEAQTVANCYTAIELGVEVIPVLNKMDLPSADPEAARQEVEDVIGLDASEAILASAKTGMGIDDILEAIVARIPAPVGDPSKPLQALIIDSWFDNYVGVVMLVRIVNGVLRPKDKLLLMASGANHFCEHLGVFTPKSSPRTELSAGQVGFVIAGIKQLEDAKVGDTITLANKPSDTALPGFKEVKPQVFAGLYPVENSEYDQLRDSLEKLKLNDSSLMFEPEVSQALGFGFRCGFLGLLHMEIVQERLEREFDMDIITTAPSVVYEVEHRDGRLLMVESPSRMPEVGEIVEVREPIVNITLFMPQDYVGPVMSLCMAKRGVQLNMTYHGRQVHLTYEMPLAEIVLDFFDRLKSVSRGYASMDYEFKEYRVADVVRVDLLINNERVDALSMMVHRSNARYRGREVVTKMRGLIPRQMFDIAIQSAIGAEVIARENVKALRKNVLAKCYGGDISRKKKLLEKQKAGKKRMKQVGRTVVRASLSALLACSLAAPAVWAQSAPDTANVPVLMVPDFTAVVAKTETSVVNIRTTEAVPVRGSRVGPGNSDPYDMFRWFFGPDFMPPGMPNKPDRGTTPAPHQQERTVPRGVGSGFIISSDGYIITNNHVVAKSNGIFVTLTSGKEYPAKIIGTDPRTDVALIKIEAENLPTLPIGDSNRLKKGQWVLAIGSPFGLDSTVTSGIVSAINRETGDYLPFIQTDVAVNPGNSGGPLIDLAGQVVGMNSQIVSQSGGFMGISLAIPIDEVMRVVDQLKAHGKVTRGRIGVQIGVVSDDVAKAIGLDTAQGALVSNVEKDGPADKSGVRSGDVILTFDGKEIKHMTDLPRIVGSTKPGNKAFMEVWRKGKKTTLSVVVAEIPSTDDSAVAAVDSSTPEALPADTLGLQVSAIPEAVRSAQQVSNGVLVVQAEGPAATAGLAEGDIIVTINDVDITSTEQYTKVVSGLSASRAAALLVVRGDQSQWITVTPSK